MNTKALNRGFAAPVRILNFRDFVRVNAEAVNRQLAFTAVLQYLRHAGPVTTQGKPGVCKYYPSGGEGLNPTALLIHAGNRTPAAWPVMLSVLKAHEGETFLEMMSSTQHAFRPFFDGDLALFEALQSAHDDWAKGSFSYSWWEAEMKHISRVHGLKWTPPYAPLNWSFHAYDALNAAAGLLKKAVPGI